MPWVTEESERGLEDPEDMVQHTESGPQRGATRDRGHGQRRETLGRSGTSGQGGPPQDEGELVRGEQRSEGGHTTGGSTERTRSGGQAGGSRTSEGFTPGTSGGQQADRSHSAGEREFGDASSRDYGDTQFGRQSRGEEHHLPRERYRDRQGGGMQDPADPSLPQHLRGDEE